MKAKEKPPTLINIVEIKSNSIGGADMHGNRIKALNSLPLAKEQVTEKLSKGFKFMNKEKTTKLVAPENVEKHLLDGWK